MKMIEIITSGHIHHLLLSNMKGHPELNESGYLKKKPGFVIKKSLLFYIFSHYRRKFPLFSGPS